MVFVNYTSLITVSLSSLRMVCGKSKVLDDVFRATGFAINKISSIGIFNREKPLFLLMVFHSGGVTKVYTLLGLMDQTFPSS